MTTLIKKTWYDQKETIISMETRSVDGELNGICKIWYKNSYLYKSITFKMGIKNGLFTSYYNNGILLSTGEYKNGYKHGEWKDYGLDGRIEFCRSYSNKKKHGKYITWWSNGNVRTECKFVLGQIHGVRTEHSLEGELTLLEHWYNGTRYPSTILPILQRKVKAKILHTKFDSLIKTEGFQQAWMDPQSFGGYFYKKRFLQKMMEMV